MKKFTLAAITAAVAMGWTGTALAVVDLTNGTGSVPYAVELVTNNVTTLSGVTTTNKLGFGVSAGQTRFVRYDLTNSTFAAAVAAGALVLTPTAASNTVVSQGGGIGGNFVIFQITADLALGADQADNVGFDPGILKVTDKSGSATFKYSLYESAAAAQAGGAAGLLSTAMAAVATFPSGLTYATVTNSTQAEVTTLYTQFNNGVTTTLAKIGSVTYAPNTSVYDPATGLPQVPGNMVKYTAAGTKLVLTGADLTAAAANGLYLAAVGNTCNPASGIVGTNRTSTTVDFVIDANNVGSSTGTPPNIGQDICFQATGANAIAAQDFTVAATVVPAAGTSTTSQAAVAAGTFTRNGTILKAAFADTTTASGVGMAVHLVNTSSIPAPYTVRCLLPTTSVAGTPGTVPGNTARRQSIAGGMGCPADGSMRGIELTLSVPEGTVIGSIVRQNVSTGAASFDSMVGSK